MQEANKRLVDDEEEEAFRGAWEIVKTKFELKGGRWVEKNAKPPAGDLSFLCSLEKVLSASASQAVTSAAAREETTSAEVAFAKAEASLDALVAARRARYGEAEELAMTRVLETPEARRAYADMVRAQAQRVSLPQDLAKQRQAEWPFNNPAERELEESALQRANARSISKAAAYVEVLATDKGRRLYAASLSR